MADTNQFSVKLESTQPSVEEIIRAIGPDTSVSWDITGHGYFVCIRPLGGGFPLVKGHSGSFTEALRQAFALWEVR